MIMRRRTMLPTAIIPNDGTERGAAAASILHPYPFGHRSFLMFLPLLTL